ncbi:MAG: septal ring lytic transglycosylase RlpA family protein [Actinomycetota bacterium]
MTRLPRAAWRALIPLSLALVVATAGAALAQEPRQPVLDSAPKEVGFRRGAAVRGHLEGGMPGDEVALERRKPHGEWRTIRTQMIDEEGRVEFRLSDLRRTADYRLAYTDPATELTASETARIRVRPKLRFRLRPNDILKGRTVKLTGSLYPKTATVRRVVIHQRVAGEWRWIDKVSVKDGSFSAAFKARRRGYRSIRVTFRGDEFNPRKAARRTLRVYNRALATWYGPGFYGNRTACGKRLGSETLGVAHRSLPCGTKVAILYQGRTITVPVIDRGPYTSADYDLTQETAERLRFRGSDTIGVTH